MNLTIDIGNTRAKVAIFENDAILNSFVYDAINSQVIQDLKAQFPKLKSVILSTVNNQDIDLQNFLKLNFDYFIELDADTNIPIENLYESKQTLGKDRLAAVIGANNIFPDSNVLVIDMGTAITFDFINKKNQYEGGTISPGLEMRFKALNHFTKRLPLLNKAEEYNRIGKNTKDAITSGVQSGIEFETDSYIKQFKNDYENLKIILTGGDAIFFDKKLKNTIFVDLNLNLIGLNTILEYNKQK